jgi:6-phosphogluconolactonase
MIAANRSIIYVSCSKGDCIEVIALDRATGALARIETVALPGNGMPLAIAPNRQYLYAAVASLGRTGGPQYESFRIAPATGKLKHLSTTKAPGRMSHITVDRSGRHLLGASVANDLIASNAIEAGGILSAEPTVTLNVPSKAHQITTDHTNSFAYVPNLGADLVMQLTFDATAGTFADNTPPTVPLPESAAPRHIAHHPGGSFAYLLSEEDGAITAFEIDSANGTLKSLQTSDFLPENFDGKPWGAQILVTPDGRNLFASDRTSSTISHHTIDPASGRLTKRHSFATEECPRSFAIDPTGAWLIVAGEKSNRIATYAIDPATGELVHKSTIDTCAGPLWVEVMELS